jgi:hypothetical protein
MKNFLIISLSFFMMVFVSCSNDSKNTNYENQEITLKETGTSTTSSTTPSYAMDGISIEEGGSVIGGVTQSGSNTIVRYQGKTYEGKYKGEKRKYYQNGELAYVIKYKSDGFKLRDANEDLLWKVKIYEDKYKLGQDEELNDFYELKRKDGKVAFTVDGKEAMRYKTVAGEPIMLKEKFQFKNTTNTMAPGLFLIDQLPKEQAMIIMAEMIYPVR